MTTLTIMRILPREVDPLVYNMLTEDPGHVPYSDVGGLSEQLRELREVVELPLTNPELFQRKNDFFKVNFRVMVFRSWNQNSKRSTFIWSAWNWKDFISKSHSFQYGL